MTSKRYEEALKPMHVPKFLDIALRSNVAEENNVVLFRNEIERAIYFYEKGYVNTSKYMDGKREVYRLEHSDSTFDITSEDYKLPVVLPKYMALVVNHIKTNNYNPKEYLADFYSFYKSKASEEKLAKQTKLIEDHAKRQRIDQEAEQRRKRVEDERKRALGVADRKYSKFVAKSVDAAICSNQALKEHYQGLLEHGHFHYPDSPNAEIVTYYKSRLIVDIKVLLGMRFVYNDEYLINLMLAKCTISGYSEVKYVILHMIGAKEGERKDSLLRKIEKLLF